MAAPGLSTVETDAAPRTRAEANPTRFAPLHFARMPDDVLAAFPLYMRNLDVRGGESFTLYASPGTPFTAEHRRRLYDLGASFLYIPAADQPDMRRRLEEKVEAVAANPALDFVARCEIVYETAYELFDDAIVSRELRTAIPRLRRVAAAIMTLYQENRGAFTHLFNASRHDACLATHAANAAAWLPALALATGEQQPGMLRVLCQGAFLYDIGMAWLPPAIRNSRTRLSAAEKQAMQQHPEIGSQLLREITTLDPIIATMAIQHHERLDGSGYPRGLTFDRVHPAARMIAIIDAYDAMTSFRPYRNAGLSPAAALAHLRKEATHRYDPKLVELWAGLLTEACPDIAQPPADANAQTISRRRFQRYAVKCPATLVRLELVAGIWTPRESLDAVAHNLSRGGLGLLSRTRLTPGQYFRAQLRRKDGLVQELAIMIVRARDYGEGWFEAGARFVDLAREAAPLPNGEFV